MKTVGENKSQGNWLRFIVAALVSLAVLGPVGVDPVMAVQPGEILKDKVLENAPPSSLSPRTT